LADAHSQLIRSKRRLDWPVIFCIAKGDMILLQDFIKKTQKRPQRDIDLANQRRKEIE
jgi:phage-related protein